MAQHARLKIEAGERVYFCEPHSPSQPGTNEKTNGLLRQYFPQRDRSQQHAQRQRDCSRGRRPQLAAPKDACDWKTPAEALDRFLLSADKDRVATTSLNPPRSGSISVRQSWA